MYCPQHSGKDDGSLIVDFKRFQEHLDKTAKQAAGSS